MSLLDKIDILITPNAYKKGKLFAALPSPTFGGELAGDGDFADGSTAWTLNPGWSIGGNSARYDGNALGTSISQNIIGVTGGNRYTVTFEVTQNTGDQNNTVSLGSTTLTNSTHLPLGCNTFTGVAGFGTALNIYGNSGELLIIRNLTVKQELTGIADLDFTRASAATRVDPLGFINYAGVLPGVEQVTNGNFQQIGPEQVSNGDFDEIGPEEVSNGDFDQIGPEEVSNGDFSEEGAEEIPYPDFSSGIGWNGSISVAGGQGTKTSGGLAYQVGVITSGKQYKIVVDVASLDGTTNIYAGGNNSAALSVGVQTIYMTGGSSNNFLGLNNGYSTGVGTVFNNISVKEVGQDWEVTDGTVTFNNEATFDINSKIRQNIFDIGKVYKFTYEVTENTGGMTLRFYNGAAYTFVDNSVGIHTVYLTATSTTYFYISTLSGTSLTLKSVSVKEVGQDWTVTGTDSTHYVEFLSTGARFVSDTTSPVLELKQNAITSGKQYVLTCNVAYTGAGQLRVNVGSNLTAFTEGANTRYFTASSSTMSFLRENTNVDALLSNVSVKEVGQDWTLTAGWSIGDGVAVRADESGNTPIAQYIPVINGRNYKFSYTRNYVSGNGTTNIYVKLDNINYTTLGNYSSTVVEEHTVTGTFTAGFTGSMSWNIYGIGTFTGTLDNISVKEVFQGWTIPTSPELSLGSVTFTSNNQNLFQAWTEETGTTYYIQLEGEGPVRLRTGFAGIPGQMIDVTLPDIITVNTDADTNRIQIYGSSSGTAVLTNVSVVEGGEIDIPRIDYTGGGCPHILVEPQRTNLGYL